MPNAVTERPGTIWYDGSWRDRREVTERVERDVRTFLADRLRDLVRDHTPWRLLVGELRVPFQDQISEATMVHDYGVERRVDDVVVHLAPVYSRTLAAIHAAACAQAWCVDAKLEPGRIVMHVRLDPSQAGRIGRGVCAIASASREAMRGGVGGFLAILQPDASPRIAAELDAALREIDRIEAEKMASIERVTRGAND